MRKPLFALLVVLAMAAVPTGIGLASTSFQQQAKVALTDHHAGSARAGASVGLSVNVVSTDAGVLGGKPKAAKRVVMDFPAGTRINLHSSVAKPCTLTDHQLTTAFGPMCPDGSQIGTGTALINTMPMGVPLTKVKAPLVATVRARAHAYVHSGNELIVVLYLNTYDLPGAPPIILHAHASGHSLTVDVPRIVYGKRKTKELDFPGVTGTIVSLKLAVPPRGVGSHALLRAGTCTQGRFIVTSHFTYFDRTRAAVRSASKCAR